MAKRDEVMSTFGPKLIEALALMLLDEINILRSKAGLSPRTLNQVFDQITNHHGDLPNYEWMNEGP